jgi:MFS family permease
MARPRPLIGRFSGSRAAVTAVILVAAFIIGLNFTILTILLPTISSELDCTVEEAAWVTIGPMFASVVFAPMCGNLADLYARRTSMWQLGFALHLLGLLIAGFAPTIGVLTAARLLTGIAMACDAPTGFAIMVAGLPADQRGKIAAYQMAVNTLGPSLGVGLGGILSEIVGWRMLFLGPFVPLLMIWLLSFLVLPSDSTPAQSPRRAASGGPSGQTFDYAGALVFGCCMLLLLLSVNRGNDLGWDSPLILGSAVGSLVLMAVLVSIERRAINPIIPSFLFTDRTICVANILPMPAGMEKTSLLGPFLYAKPIFLPREARDRHTGGKVEKRDAFCAGMSYMASMINLPIFLEQVRKRYFLSTFHGET